LKIAKLPGLVKLEIAFFPLFPTNFKSYIIDKMELICYNSLAMMQVQKILNHEEFLKYYPHYGNIFLAQKLIFSGHTFYAIHTEHDDMYHIRLMYDDVNVRTLMSPKLLKLAAQAAYKSDFSGLYVLPAVNQTIDGMNTEHLFVSKQSDELKEEAYAAAGIRWNMVLNFSEKSSNFKYTIGINGKAFRLWQQGGTYSFYDLMEIKKNNLGNDEDAAALISPSTDPKSLIFQKWQREIPNLKNMYKYRKLPRGIISPADMPLIFGAAHEI
jgi:hypothetical protein